MISKNTEIIAVCMIVGFLANAGPVFGQDSFSDNFENWRGDRRILHALFRDMPLGGDLHSHLSGAVDPDTLIAIAKNHDYDFAFDNNGNFLGFVLPGRKAWNPNPPSFLQVACNRGRIGSTQIDCLSTAQITAAHYPAIRLGLTIDDQDSARGENDDFKDFTDVFRRADDLTDNTDVMPELIHVLMDQASDLNISYLELKMSPYGRANTQRQETRIEDLLNSLELEISAKNKAYRRSGKQPVVVKIIAQLKRDEPLDRGGATNLPYIRRVGHLCDTRWQQAHYLVALSRFSDFVVAYDFVRLPEVPISFPGSTLVSEVQRLTALYGPANLTIHSGESHEPANRDNIQRSISAGAKRIGHGYNLDTLASNATRNIVCQGNITLEVSLSSNVLLEVAPDIPNHPFEDYVKGTICTPDTPLPVTLNTDDAGIFRTDLAKEFCLAAANFPNLTWDEIKRVARQSLVSAYAPASEKTILLIRWNQAIADFEANWTPPAALPSECVDPT